MARNASPSDELPKIRTVFRLGGKAAGAQSSMYDVKFYPFAAPGIDPIFAAVGVDKTIVCRPRSTSPHGLDILRWFADAQGAAAGLNSCTWTVDAATGHPVICVTGGDPKIKLLDVVDGCLVDTLTGHGAEVNDLQTSPVDPMIIASASVDNTVRVWHLDPAKRRQPCAAICAGDGHRAGVLSVAFHPNGRWLLSSGFDAKICLWALPPSDHLADVAGTDHPVQIHYPHFMTTEVHTDYTDCVAFHGDLIVSKCARENRIIIWRITDFDPDIPPEDSPPAPAFNARNLAYQTDTRSAFIVPPADSTNVISADIQCAFQVVLTLQLPKAEHFFMRFAIFPGLPSPPPSNTTDEDVPDGSHESIPLRLSRVASHPVVACGNQASRMFFWDLALLEAGRLGTQSTLGGRREGAGRKKKGTLARELFKESSISTRATPASDGTGSRAPSRVPDGDSDSIEAAKSFPFQPANDVAVSSVDTLEGPFYEQRAHMATTIPNLASTTLRTTAWSPGGEYCVTVGDGGTISIFRRFDEITNSVEWGAVEGDGQNVEDDDHLGENDITPERDAKAAQATDDLDSDGATNHVGDEPRAAEGKAVEPESDSDVPPRSRRMRQARLSRVVQAEPALRRRGRPLGSKNRT